MLTDPATTLGSGIDGAVRYPNARLVRCTCGSAGGADDNLNRLAAIKDDNRGSPGGTLAAVKRRPTPRRRYRLPCLHETAEPHRDRGGPRQRG